MLKAKYAECKDELADLEEVMTYVVVCSNISIMCSSMIQVAHEKCPTLVDTVSAIAEKFTTVFSLLGRCHSIYDQLFIDELKVTFQVPEQ